MSTTRLIDNPNFRKCERCEGKGCRLCNGEGVNMADVFYHFRDYARANWWYKPETTTEKKEG